MENHEKIAVQIARKKFAAMAATYSLGVFNDNFFKTAAILIMVNRKEWILALFTLPFIFLAAPAGWMADRFSKRNVVIFSKILEFIAMLFGAVGIITGSWPMICVMVTIMAGQSTIFSPSLNGSIPELYPASYVTKANAFLKGFVTIAILLGTVMAGYALSFHLGHSANPSHGRYLVAFMVVLIALAGVVTSMFVPRRAAADAEVRFPWKGIISTFVNIWELRKDRLLVGVVGINVFIWFIGSLQILIVFDVCKIQFVSWGDVVASNMLFCELIGVAVGGGIAAKISHGQRWHWFFPWSNLLMGISLGFAAVFAMAETVGLVYIMYFLMFLTGVFGGTILIPCESFIQVRPLPAKKGQVIASANCAVFIGILLSAGVSGFLLKFIEPVWGFAVAAGIIELFGIWLFIKFR